jgi:hypothetical protein
MDHRGTVNHGPVLRVERIDKQRWGCLEWEAVSGMVVYTLDHQQWWWSVSIYLSTYLPTGTYLLVARSIGRTCCMSEQDWAEVRQTVDRDKPSDLSQRMNATGGWFPFPQDPDRPRRVESAKPSFPRAHKDFLDAGNRSSSMNATTRIQWLTDWPTDSLGHLWIRFKDKSAATSIRFQCCLLDISCSFIRVTIII